VIESQRGGFVLGLVVGLLIGLALALAVALYVTKVPVPFINKVPQRTAEQDAAEAERNKGWDPNAPLTGKTPRPGAASGVVTGAPVAARPAGPASVPADPRPAAAAVPAVTASAAGARPRDPAAILSGAAVPPADAGRVSAKSGGDPFIYFVQAGAFQRAEEAEAQRAKLGMAGIESKILEREQAGRTVYRVRAGPLDKHADAEAMKERLAGAGIESVIVRAERPRE